MTQARRRDRGLVLLLALALPGVALTVTSIQRRMANAAVATVTGSACGYFTNVSLFGGPPNLRGCGQSSGGAGSASPSVTLPPGGSGTAVTGSAPAGATATYGPAKIFSGQYPNLANDPMQSATSPPSGPLSVSTQGTTGEGGSVTSSASVGPGTQGTVDPTQPRGIGPGPFVADAIGSTCTASSTQIHASTQVTNGILVTSTDPGGAARTWEPVPSDPPPNYTRSGVITNVGDVFTVVYNQQTIKADGSIAVDALHAYLFGPTAVGEMVIAQSTCGTAPSAPGPPDTAGPSCGIPVVAPNAPDDPTPQVPRKELVGVFDAGGVKSIDNVQASNGTVQIGQPDSSFPFLVFHAGQTNPVPVTATRTDEALPLVWSFDATDMAGNVSHCQGVSPSRVSGLFPNTGPAAGGNDVVITGTGFMGATGVRFGSVAASTFRVDSDTQITAVAPPGSAGPVTVSVTTPGGTLSTSGAGGYTYQGLPSTTTSTTTTSSTSTTSTTAPTTTSSTTTSTSTSTTSTTRPTTSTSTTSTTRATTSTSTSTTRPTTSSTRPSTSTSRPTTTTTRPPTSTRTSTTRTSTTSTSTTRQATTTTRASTTTTTTMPVTMRVCAVLDATRDRFNRLFDAFFVPSGLPPMPADQRAAVLDELAAARAEGNRVFDQAQAAFGCPGPN